MVSSGTGGRRQRGFTYIALLFWVAITGAALGGVAEFWSTVHRREKEAELIYIGEQFQAALERYGGSGRFPRRLEELLGNDNAVPLRRYLRTLYIDPMTGRPDWGLVTLPDGQIIGIHSLSDEKPLKQGGFPERHAALADKTRYSAWVFYAANAPQPAGTPPGFGAGR